MILKGCTIFYPRLVNPNPKFDPDNPTWEVCIRTADKATNKLWKESGVTTKAVVPDDGEPYFEARLKKRKFKKTGEENQPPDCVDGARNEVDGNTVGNGSIGNIRVFQYQYGDNKEKTANVLMAIQLVRHIKYTPKSREDFDECTTEIVTAAEESMDESSQDNHEKAADDDVY